MTVFKINKRNGAFPRLGGTAALTDASPEELRVLLCLVEAGEADAAALASASGCSRARVGAALSYWQELSVICEADKAAPLPKPVCEEAEELPAAEVAESIKRTDSRAFIEACQQTVGRIFTLRELNILSSLIEEMPFSEEYLLTLISYVKTKTKRFSFHYLEKVAHTMLERECLTVEGLQQYLDAVARFSSEEWRLRRLLGIGERKLGTKEEAMFLRWTGDFGYDSEIVGIAYDITVNQTGKISLPYMDKLLTRWHEAGARTVREVEDLLDRERAEHAAKKDKKALPVTKGNKTNTKFSTTADESDPTATKGKSFSSEDYMAAALRRSYGDDGTEG